MDLIECPECGSTKPLIYEYFHMFRRYPQTEDGIDHDRYDEEHFPKEEPLTSLYTACTHEWASDEGTVIDDIIW
jgi:hypothetical protein